MEKLAQTQERETGGRNAALYEPPFIPNEGKDAPEEKPRTSLLGRPHALGILLGLTIVAAIAVFSLWKYYSVRESTDDAQIEAHIHPISARVGGTVVTVNITEGRRVEAGQVLVEIDPKDYQVALEQDLRPTGPKRKRCCVAAGPTCRSPRPPPPASFPRPRPESWRREPIWLLPRRKSPRPRRSFAPRGPRSRKIRPCIRSRSAIWSA